MVTTKEIEDDREEYILGYNTCKEDVNKLIDEYAPNEGFEELNLIIGKHLKKIQARING